MDKIQDPKRRGHLIDAMGPQVKVTNDKMENDIYAATMLRETAKALRPGDHSYLGSVAVHYYASGPLSVSTKDVAWKAQIIGAQPNEGLADNLNEQVAVFSIADFAQNLRKHYHPDFEPKTLHTGDKRT